jgi:hypothetical protein
MNGLDPQKGGLVLEDHFYQLFDFEGNFFILKIFYILKL